jgi:hypothetical protein
MVIAILWKMNNSDKLAKGHIPPQRYLFQKLNEELIAMNERELTESELTQILDDLSRLRIIYYNLDGSITLIEKIKIQ